MVFNGFQIRPFLKYMPIKTDQKPSLFELRIVSIVFSTLCETLGHIELSHPFSMFWERRRKFG